MLRATDGRFAELRADRRVEAEVERGPRIAAVAIITLGALVLLGWMLDVPTLKSVLPSWVAMTPNTALAFVLCGISLALSATSATGPRWKIAGASAAVVVAAAALILSQDVFGWDAGVDRILLDASASAVGTGHPGRMAPSTALCFITAGASLLALAVPGRRRAGWLLGMQCAAALIAGMAALALISFAAGMPMVFRWRGITPMAFPTALGFLALAFGLFAILHRQSGDWLINKRATLAFAGSLLLTLVISGLSSKSTILMEDTNRQLDRAAQIRFQSSRVLESLERLETGQRGYLLTGQQDFLQPYVTASRSIPGELSKLSELVATSPAWKSQVRELQTLVTARLQIAGLTLDAYRRGGTGAALAHIRSGRGETLMGLIREQVAQIDREQRGVVARSQAKADRVATTVFALLPAGALISVIILSSGLLLLNREASERARAERERDRFFTLSLDMMCIADADGYFKRVSPAFTRTLGWSIEELLARPFLEFVHPQDHEATLREVERQVVAGEPVLQFENRYAHKDGGWRVLSWKSSPQADGRMYAAARDVTESRLAEQNIIGLNHELTERQVALEEANQELESFSYSVSHDLRAPLRHIDGYARMLSEDVGDSLPPEARRFLQTIIDSARRMGVLIDDLLAFSRLGRKSVAMEPVDMGELVARAINDARAAHPLPAKIETAIPRLPTIAGDPALLQQVWNNLIANALKYSAPRGAAARVVISGEARDGRMYYTVRDNGVGFDMRYADKLFGVFQRLHAPSEFEGTGVGLAIVQRIVHRHGGHVSAQSRLDEGACFSFDLPISGVAS